MLLNTLSDVLQHKDEIVQKVLQNGKKTDDFILFSEVEMDGIVVFDDEIASKHLEALYVYDTHLAPHRLPSDGMCIGDIITHDEKRYFTFHHDVAMSNSAAIHYLREHEKAYVEWNEKSEDLNREAKELIAQVRLVQPDCFGLKDIQEFEFISSPIGFFDDVQTPSPSFVQALQKLSGKLRATDKANKTNLSKQVADLANKCRPYRRFQGLMKKIRKHHKGMPYIAEGMIRLSSPSASGGATWHTRSTSDNAERAIPGGTGLTMIAIQAGNMGSNMTHIGSGSCPGEHYFMVVPETPFFALAQKRIDEDQSLVPIWNEVSVKVGTGPGYYDKSMKWMRATESIKQEVARAIIPDLIVKHVLGFHLDLNKKRNTALIRPVIAQSLFQKEEPLIKQSGLEVIRPHFDGFFAEFCEGYAEFPFKYKDKSAAA